MQPVEYRASIEELRVEFGVSHADIERSFPTEFELFTALNRLEVLRNKELVRQRVQATRNLRAKLNRKNQQRNRQRN
jgi:hypothetical protein